MLTIALMIATFFVGYYVAGHPDDTRAFATRVGDALKTLPARAAALFKRKD